MARSPQSMKELLVEYFSFVVSLASDIINSGSVAPSDVERVKIEHDALVRRLEDVTAVSEDIKAQLHSLKLSGNIDFIPKDKKGLCESLRYLWLNFFSIEYQRLGDEQCLKDRLVEYRDSMSHIKLLVENCTME